MGTCMYVCSPSTWISKSSEKLTASIIITRSPRMICTRATLIHGPDVVLRFSRPLNSLGRYMLTAFAYRKW